MKISQLKITLAFCMLGVATTVSAQVFDLIPLYGIRMNSQNLTYSNVTLDAGTAIVVKNEIPQNTEFSIVVQKPEGFRDSAGWVLYGMEYTLIKEDGTIAAHVNDIFSGKGSATDTALQSLRLTNTFNTETKPGSKLTAVGKIFDRNGPGYISFSYDFIVISASKKLPTKLFTYNTKDTRGMRATSVGLHFNFFEFKGLSGNNFLFRLQKEKPIEVQLRGLEGWKNMDGKVSPTADITIMDVSGKELETASNILSKTLGATMPVDKKELTIKYQPQMKLQTGQFYFAWIRVRDANSTKAAMDVVVKFYVED